MHILAVDNGPLINLINTPIMDGEAFKLLNVDILMVSILVASLLHFVLLFRVLLSLCDSFLYRASDAFGALTLLVGQQERQLECKKMLQEYTVGLGTWCDPAAVKNCKNHLTQSLLQLYRVFPELLQFERVQRN